jgi:hypothetical protein
MIEAEQGYVILAVNTPDADYVSMAQHLAHSLRQWHPRALTCLVTDQDPAPTGFDWVKLLPYGAQPGYHNDWQLWYTSPFRETIKLEADMLVTSEIDHWWYMLRHRDVVISTGARDFYDRTATSRYYRRVFDQNDLPDVYNAITYWRVSATAREFWRLVRSIFTNWSSHRTVLKFAPEQPDTDLVYALAAQIMGPEMVTLPFASYPRITHMKQHIIPTHRSDWTQELIWEKDDNGVRVNTVQQWGCWHYHQKHWIAHAD